MANPIWFNEAYYLDSKLNQLQEAGKTQFTTANQVYTAIIGAGMTTYEHFEKFSLEERTSPNAYFDAEEYLAAKAAQSGKTMDQVALGIQQAGMSLYGHFAKYGWAENVNPSNAFDVSDYIAAKAADSGKTVEEVTAAFKANGFDPVGHFMAFGEAEGLTVPAVPADEQVDPSPNTDGGQTFTLTTGQDIFNGGSRADIIRGVAGVTVGQQDQTTLNSSDILDGGAGEDKLVVNMTGPNYTGGATIKNIETIQIGTNVTPVGGVTFDYNINNGAYEITKANTIIFDQITTGENLNVINIVNTAVGDVIPTLSWENEAGSGAGYSNVTFRQAAIATNPTNLNVVLSNVANGDLGIARGIETVTITSSGTTTNMLSNAVMGARDGRAVDLVSENAGGNGVNDDSTLTKVVVKGEMAFGRAATVNTNDAAGEVAYGMTNRVANGANDLGIVGTLQGSSASNLISVAASVTEIDATEANGGVAMRFDSRVDGAAVNVTFKGGKAADYVEFVAGNINATGGEGTDTFAFLNSALTNFDFGSADTIAGGAGSDTIQLGVNGNGVVVANTTEFNNKTGIDVLDLRGLTNTVTLADAFVAGADAGAFIVRTDKIIQTSATSTANTTPSNAANNAALENNSVNTVVLTELADNRAIEFIGGSGSDRIIVDNASANQFTKLDGGTNAAAGSNDSLTVVNTSVLDANDVANIKGFELLNFVESTLGNSTFNLTVSEAFLLANTTTTVNLTLASVTNTYGQRLGAGDTVNIEISDLLNGAVAKPSIANRVLNIQDLIAAGVTVNFQQNGVTVSTNAAPAALAANINTTTVPAATVLDDVTGAVAGGGGGVGGLVPTGTVVAVADNTAIAGSASPENFTMASTADQATVNGGGGVDWLTLAADAATAAGVIGSLAGAAAGNYTITNLEAVKLADGGNAAVTINDASTLATVVGGTGADAVLLTALASGGATISLGDGGDTLSIGTGIAQVGTTYDGGAGNDIIRGVAAFNNVNLSVSTITNFEQLDLTAVALFNYTLTVEQYNGFTAGIVGAAGNDTITFSNAGTVTVGLLQDTINTFVASAAGNTITISTNTAHVVTGAAGADSITGGGGADSLTGGAGNDSIIGGAANDAIQGGTGADVLTGGAGTNTFEFSAGDTGVPTVTNFDTITDFRTGTTNVIDGIGGLALIVGTQNTAAGAGVATIGATGLVTFNGADTTFAQHLTAVNAALDGAGVVAGETAIWQEGANAFLFVTDGVAGLTANDLLIQLTGVTVAAGGLTFAAGSITAIA